MIYGIVPFPAGMERKGDTQKWYDGDGIVLFEKGIGDAACMHYFPGSRADLEPTRWAKKVKEEVWKSGLRLMLGWISLCYNRVMNNLRLFCGYQYEYQYDFFK